MMYIAICNIFFSLGGGVFKKNDKEEQIDFALILKS